MGGEEGLLGAARPPLTLRRRLADAARRRRAVQRLELRLRPGMRARDAVGVLSALDDAGIEAHVTGGWGIDALVGRQTRRHRDLDLVVLDAQLGGALRVLASMGFVLRAQQMVPEAGLPQSLACVSRRGRRVDLHPLDGSPARANGSAEASFAVARGAIAGRAVSCLSAQTQLAHHAGYPSRIVDAHDVELVQPLARAGER